MKPPLRVAIVEDEALQAMLLQGFLEDAGHAVVGWATTASEGGRMIAKTNPDLIFVDLHLADGQTGVTLAEELRRHARSVVFITANARMLPTDYAGALGVIGKPYTTHGIRNALEYLAQGLCNPPPRCERPSSLTLAPTIADRWH